MVTRGKVFGISALIIVIAVVGTLIVLNKPLPTDDAETVKVMQPKLSALDEYLANPPAVENAPWAKSTPPNESIPNNIKRLASGDTEVTRAIAIGSLAFTASQMSGVTETQDAAKEVLEKWVMPNLSLTKILPETNPYCWQDTLLRARTAYRSLGNQTANRACLALLRDEGIEQDDREMAIYLLAYDYMQSKEYEQAINTFQTLPTDSRWADQRPRITELWMKKQADEEKAKQPVQDPQVPKP